MLMSVCVCVIVMVRFAGRTGLPFFRAFMFIEGGNASILFLPLVFGVKV